MSGDQIRIWFRFNVLVSINPGIFNLVKCRRVLSKRIYFVKRENGLIFNISCYSALVVVDVGRSECVVVVGGS